MERARNSDSETHVKKYNWTSGTDLSKKSLWDIFFGAPCMYSRDIQNHLQNETFGIPMKCKHYIFRIQYISKSPNMNELDSMLKTNQ